MPKYVDKILQTICTLQNLVFVKKRIKGLTRCKMKCDGEKNKV